MTAYRQNFNRPFLGPKADLDEERSRAKRYVSSDVFFFSFLLFDVYFYVVYGEAVEY